jgi:type II secretion system protein G
MKKGFTLVELLVVITIISLLTVITVSQFQTAKKKSNDVARKGDLNAVSKALQMYFNDYGVFPATDVIVWGGTFEDSSVNPAYVYMKKLPRENYTTAKPYCYKTSADLKKYAIFAQLENTVDKECANTYMCNGVSYCYGIVSPNSGLNNDGSLQ